MLEVVECAPPAYEQLGSDEYLLGVRVEITAKTADVPRNFYYGRLLDSEHNAYSVSFAGCEPRLTGKPLEPGESARGFINFKLPKKSSQLTLEYAPRIGNSEKARGPKLTKQLGR